MENKNIYFNHTVHKVFSIYLVSTTRLFIFKIILTFYDNNLIYLFICLFIYVCLFIYLFIYLSIIYFNISRT